MTTAVSDLEPGIFTLYFRRLENTAGLAPIKWDLTYGVRVTSEGVKRAETQLKLIEYNMIKIKNHVKLYKVKGSYLIVCRTTYAQHKLAFERLSDCIKHTKTAMQLSQTALDDAMGGEDELPF